MENWVIETAKLLGQWDQMAAEKALIHLSQEREKTTDELLMGYAIAERILDNVFSRYISQKDTLSDKDENNLELAINLAHKSIPKGHPLLYIFLKSVSHMRVDLVAEADELGKSIFNNNV